MNNSKNKLILSLYIGCIALSVATLSMSIAWFATSTRVQVSTIDISIDCDRELFISTERDGEYVERLEQDQLMQSGEFMPLTSAHSSKWLSLKSDTPHFYDETRYSTYEDAELISQANRGYFSQKLYLKSDDDVYVTIDSSKTLFVANEAENLKFAEKLYEEYQAGDDDYHKGLSVEQIAEHLNKIKNAMRFSILVTNEDDYSYTIIDPCKNEEVTYLGGLLDNDIDGYYDYFVRTSDNKYYERVYGEVIGDKNNIEYDPSIIYDSGILNPNEEPSAFNAKHRRDVERFNKDASEDKGFYIKTEEAIDLIEFKAGEPAPYHIPVYRDEPQEIVVSIYIEGWDLDSVNYTMGAKFISNVAFMIEREM